MGNDSQPKEPKGRRKRSGSETRKRSLPPFPLRLGPDERAIIEAAADREGLSIGGYIRSRALATPTTRARRRPSVDVLALAKALAVVNRMGGVIHQLVKHLNYGAIPETEEVRAALRGYQDMVTAIMAAIRGEP
jgi:hypothetical protein